MSNSLLLAEINVTAILVACVIGAICGFLAGNIMKGRGFGLLGNIIVGIVGSAIFSWLFSANLQLVDAAFVNEIIGGTIGACILLFVIGLLKKAAN